MSQKRALQPAMSSPSQVQKQTPEVFCTKRFSEKFHKIHKKSPVPLFFNKVTGLSPATLWKKKLWHRCFPVNFVKFLRTPFLQKTSERLYLPVFSKHVNIVADRFFSEQLKAILGDCYRKPTMDNNKHQRSSEKPLYFLILFHYFCSVLLFWYFILAYHNS